MAFILDDYFKYKKKLELLNDEINAPIPTLRNKIRFRYALLTNSLL